MGKLRIVIGSPPNLDNPGARMPPIPPIGKERGLRVSSAGASR
jgi:hypothetical protein